MLRATGDALTPSLISVLVCVLDIFFNFFLINPTREMELFGQTVTMFGFGWGVPGAALGTALATMIGGLAALAVLLLRESPLAIRHPGSWKITRSCLINLWRVGVPLAAERAALSSAQVLLVRIVSQLGTVAIAANSLAVSAEGLCYMAGYGIQDASIALVGQAVGAHRRDMSKRFAWLCTGMGMGIMALSGVLMWLFAPALMSIFTADAAVIALGAQMLRIEAFAEPSVRGLHRGQRCHAGGWRQRRLLCTQPVQHVGRPADAGIPAGSPLRAGRCLDGHVRGAVHPGCAVSAPPCPGQVAGERRAGISDIKNTPVRMHRSIFLSDRVESAAAMQDGRQRLIDQHTEHSVQQALDQRERQVEEDEALDEAVCRGQDRLIHAQDGFQRHVVELHIGRVNDEVVGGHAQHTHGHGACHGTDDGRLAALVVLVKISRPRQRRWHPG